MKFALVGNPNCGKTTLFNALTGSTAHVGNWPGVTVEKKEGVYKKLGGRIEVIDLPGIYSLSPYSPEEVISRDFALNSNSDCIINIVDATNLERNLYLTTQLLELDTPVVIALNMMDALAQSGDTIDTKQLSSMLGVPVVEISALKGKNLDSLMKEAQKVAGSARAVRTPIENSEYKSLYKEIYDLYAEIDVKDKVFHAVKMFEGDEIEVNSQKDIASKVSKLKESVDTGIFEGDYEGIVADARYKYISSNYSKTMKKKNQNIKLTRSDKIDKVMTHRIWGIPIFLVIMLFVFHATFSENFLFLGWAFKPDTTVYNQSGEKITAFYDESGTEIKSIFDENGELLDIYDVNGNAITEFYNSDGDEVELVGNDKGKIAELAVITKVYDSEGKQILDFYDETGMLLTSFLGSDGNIIETLYSSDGKVYESFYDKDGNEVSLVISMVGELEGTSEIFDSSLKEYLAGVDYHAFLGYEEGIYSPGVVLFNTFDVVISIVTCGLSDIMPEGTWYTGLVIDGLWSGISAVLSFIPQIMMLFIFLSILEASGYMARVAFIMDRAFRKLGLSGKAFMPLLMCFGCAVPGIMATRTLENDGERRRTIMVTPFFSCGAKLPIWAAFGGIFAQLYTSIDASLLVYSMYILGIAVAIISSLILKKTVAKGEAAPFIMELPAYHMPQAKSVFVQLWEKLKHYLFRAATVIAGAVVVIWFLSTFSWKFQMVDPGDSILGSIGKGLAWLFVPLGFGYGENGWKFVVAAFTGLIAKEMVVATMGTFAGMADGESALDSDFNSAGVQGTAIGMLMAGIGGQMLGLSDIAIPAMLSFMAFNLLSIPCMAAVGAARGELSSGNKKLGRKYLWEAIGMWMATAYITSMVIFWVGAAWVFKWWLGLIVTLAIIAIVVAVLIVNAKGGFDKIKRKKLTAKKV